MTEEEATQLLSTKLGRLVLASIKKAYKVRQRTHRVADGDSATTFGSNVRFSIEKFIEDKVGSVTGAIVTRPLGSYCLSFRAQHFHFYKYGSMGQDSIDEFRFDSSITKSALVEEPQLSLPNFVSKQNFVFAHSGNHVSGIRDVYLGAANSLGLDGSPWAWRHCVFRSASESARLSHIPKAEQTEIAIPDVVVRRKPDARV